MQVNIIKHTGGFTGIPYYRLELRFDLSNKSDEEARAKAKEILEKHFPDSGINVDEIWITENFSL